MPREVRHPFDPAATISERVLHTYILGSRWRGSLNVMNGQYLMTVEVICEDGGIRKGNLPFYTEHEKLSLAHLERAKGIYCEALRKDGVPCVNHKAVILAVIPLDA